MEPTRMMLASIQNSKSFTSEFIFLFSFFFFFPPQEYIINKRKVQEIKDRASENNHWSLVTCTCPFLKELNFFGLSLFCFLRQHANSPFPRMLV